MALSNWDTLSLDHNNKPCRGVFVSPHGNKVEIYKNWISVHSKEKVGERYVYPSSMKIYDSRLRFDDVNIVSRFIGYTIYVAVWSGYDDLDDNEFPFSGMVGIGTMARGGIDEYIGVTQRHVDRLKKVLNAKTIAWEIQIPETLKNLDLTKGKRFNQGDMFFHNCLGLDTQCSVIGEEQEPHFVKMIKNMK